MTTLDPVETAITVTGAVLILFALWYLRPVEWKSLEASPKGYQEVLVNIGPERFEHSTVAIAVGIPAKIRLQRVDGSSEWESFIAPGLSVERKLPAGKTTTIDLTADEPGVFPFHSGVLQRDGVILVVKRD